ncbi:uncharacterized protein LOC143212193 [Lasioglossum baleicum]|uniref:uncharacterized protein LOC143212193 n=1 Tax=Lasioglossum baleicum TaxID=434251 RepID=UPI003FCDEE44
MGKQVPKMSARVVNAIKNLREVHGSTSKEIMSYIKSQYCASETTLQRQMRTALTRGLNYGILKKNNGNYYLNRVVPQLAPANVPTERSRRSRRRRSRKRRGRRRSRGRRRRSRRGRRRRSRRRRSRRRSVRARRAGCTNCRCIKRTRDLQMLKDNPLEPQNVEDDPCDKESDTECRSKSRDRSGTRSRSSLNSDQDAAIDDRQATRDQD